MKSEGRSGQPNRHFYERPGDSGAPRTGDESYTTGDETHTTDERAGIGRKAVAFFDERKRLIPPVALAIVVVLIIVIVAASSSGKSGSVVKAGQSATVDGRAWRVVQGDWAVKDGTWAIKTPGRLYASMVVTDGGSSDLTMQARMPVVGSGAGVVFRFQNAFNYWAIEAVQGVVSWQLIKVVDGKSQVVGNTGLSPTKNGTIVAVNTRSDGTVEISFNGRLTRTFRDTALADKRGVGFLAYGSRAGRATFSEFSTSAGVLPQTAPAQNVVPTSAARTPPKRP